MAAVMWVVQAQVDVIGANRGDVLTSCECGGVTRWSRSAQAWTEHAPVDAGLSLLDALWAAGLISPASVEDGERLRVHQLLLECRQSRLPWAS